MRFQYLLLNRDARELPGPRSAALPACGGAAGCICESYDKTKDQLRVIRLTVVDRPGEDLPTEEIRHPEQNHALLLVLQPGCMSHLLQS